MEPAYARIKQHLQSSILSGRYAPRARIPSDAELIEAFGVSRMTVIRALRELQQEGLIVRVAGVGSFVAEPKYDVPIAVVQDIATEITRTGQHYDCLVLQATAMPADDETATNMGVAPGSRVFRTVLVHRADGMPVQREDRIVNPAFRPDYLDADFTHVTPHDRLMSVAPLERIDHTIEAGLPTPEIARDLKLKPQDPCLVIHRRTWSRGMVASLARLHFPGSRYRISGSFHPAGTPA